jgi:hypothetical protein
MPFNPLGSLNILARLVRPVVSRLAQIARPAAQIGAEVTGALARSLGVAAERLGQFAREVEPDVAQLAQAEREIVSASEIIAAADRRRLVDPLTIPDATTRQRRLFNWRVKGVVRNLATGETSERFVTIATDRLLSVEEAESQARSMFVAEYLGSEDELESVEFDNVTRQAESLL